MKLDRAPDATPRLRGRAAVVERERYLRLHPLCRLCLEEGRVAQAVTPDHIVPLWKGGPDTDENKQPLCEPHHAAKTKLEASERAGLA